VQSGQMYLADGCKRLRRRDWAERRRSRMPLRVGLYWGEELSRPRGRERQGRGPAMWENLLQVPWENSLLRKCPVRYRPFKLAPTLLQFRAPFSSAHKSPAPPLAAIHIACKKDPLFPSHFWVLIVSLVAFLDYHTFVDARLRSL